MRRPHFTPPPFHPARPGLVAPVRRSRDGSTGPTVAQTRGRHWRRSSQGLYVPADVDAAPPEQRVVEAAAALPELAGLTGWAALRWLGASWFDGLTPDGTTLLPVCLAAEDMRCPQGMALSEEILDPRDLVEWHGVKVTVPLRSAAFEMRYASSAREASVVFGMAAYDDLIDITEMTEFAATLNAWTGIPQLRESLPLLHENAWSPWEIRMCNIWTVDAGLPMPLCNHPIFDRSGHHIATPDLLDVEAGLAGEYEGTVHLASGQRRKDRDREERYRQHGLEVVIMMKGDAANRAMMAARIREARSRALFQPELDRSWTTTLPKWWIPTFTVKQRRALTAEQRERLLRHRRPA